MPKVKLSPHTYDDLPRTIRMYRILRGYRSDAALAEKIGMSKASFSYRLRTPSSIDADLIDRLCRVLRIRPAQLWEPVQIGENCTHFEEVRA